MTGECKPGWISVSIHLLRAICPSYQDTPLGDDGFMFVLMDTVSLPFQRVHTCSWSQALGQEHPGPAYGFLTASRLAHLVCRPVWLDNIICQKRKTKPNPKLYNWLYASVILFLSIMSFLYNFSV